MARQKKQVNVSGEIADTINNLPKSLSQDEVQELAEKIANKIIAERDQKPVKAFAYPELESEHVTIIRFGKNTDAARTYDYLKSEEKVPLFIPVDFGGREKRGRHWHRYQLNGLILWIDKGVMVDVPKTVHDDLQNSMDDTEKALNPMVVDGDGRLVSANMALKPSVGEFAR